MHTITAQQLIAALGLAPLPMEGGYYRETYRSSVSLSPGSLPSQYQGGEAEPRPRAASTAIYYLLSPDTCSRMHRLPTDEVFHFYLGDPVEMLQLEPRTGTGKVHLLGSDVLGEQQVQVVVPAGVWQGSRLLPGGRFALMGTTMAPGFEFSDFEPGDRTYLQTAFSEFAELIAALT